MMNNEDYIRRLLNHEATPQTPGELMMVEIFNHVRLGGTVNAFVEGYMEHFPEDIERVWEQNPDLMLFMVGVSLGELQKKEVDEYLKHTGQEKPIN